MEDKHVHASHGGPTGPPIPQEDGSHIHATHIGPTEKVWLPDNTDGEHVHEYKLQRGLFTGRVVASSKLEGEAG